MNIDRDCVVLFHFTLKNADGEELESSRGGEPTAYLQGYANIIPGMESALAGRAAGDTFTLRLEAAEA